MLLSLLLAGAACVLTTDAKPDTFTTLLSPSRNLGTGYNVSSAASVVPVPSLTSVHYTFPTTAVLTPSVTSLGAVVTSLVPLYEVCNLAGSDSISCSPSIATIKTASCNTTLVGWYTTVTVSDCTQNVTFSSEKSYALLTTSAVPTATALKRDAASPVPTTVVQSVVSYYITPWQSLAVNDVSDITVLVCTTAWDTGIQTCTEVQEVWVVHVTYVPVYTTKTVSFTTSFSSPVVVLLDPTITLTASAGSFSLSTEITYTSTIAQNITTTSDLDATSTITLYKTIDQTVTVKVGPALSTTSLHAVLETPTFATMSWVNSTIKSDEPTTTLTSFVKAYRTVTKPNTVFSTIH